MLQSISAWAAASPGHTPLQQGLRRQCWSPRTSPRKPRAVWPKRLPRWGLKGPQKLSNSSTREMSSQHIHGLHTGGSWWPVLQRAFVERRAELVCFNQESRQPSRHRLDLSRMKKVDRGDEGQVGREHRILDSAHWNLQNENISWKGDYASIASIYFLKGLFICLAARGLGCSTQYVGTSVVAGGI